jgi:hypothetical protein
MDWENLFKLSEVKDWEDYCKDVFAASLELISARLSSDYPREQTREIFLSILHRLLEEGRLVHAKPGSSFNELRNSPIRPMPTWNAPPKVMVDCYGLHWPSLENPDYDREIDAYCGWGMQFAWIAWDMQLLIDEGLQRDYRPGGLWYDGYEYAKAGEWAFMPREADSASVVSSLALQRHLHSLGFDSVDALARYHFGSPFDRLLRELKLETLPRGEVQEIVLELVRILVHRGWLVHADPKELWPQQLLKGQKPLRRWHVEARDIVDCLRVQWPFTLSREPETCPYFLCDLFDFAKVYSFAWVAQGRHKGNWVKEGDDTPGSLWYDGVEIAKPGEWE